MSKEGLSIKQCVACRSHSWSLTEEWGEYELATCSDCGLTFTLNPDYKLERYAAAYEGKQELPVPDEHSYVYIAPEKRLELESLSVFSPMPRLTPAERLALKWLKSYAPKGSLIIDSGCGAGRFLRVLLNAQFQAVGVEISEALVDLLNRSGLHAIRGHAPDFAWRGPAPLAITFFEVLEHIPVPIQVIEPLRERFPNTCIIASVPSPFRAGLLLYGKRGLSDYPPNHFLRWTPKALEILFKNAGYSGVTVKIPAPVGSELMPGLGQLLSRFVTRKAPTHREGSSSENVSGSPSVFSKIAATAFLWMHRGYQVGMNVIGTPKAWHAYKKGTSAASMLVIAEPEEEVAGMRS